MSELVGHQWTRTGSETHGPQQVLVADHESDQVSSAYRLLHLTPLLANGAFISTVTASEYIGRHHHGDIPQRHSVVVLMGDHLTKEDQQGL